MTPPDRPEGRVPDADPLDELASALVDGEATAAAEQARAAEPEVARRVAAFEAIARRVGQPSAPPDETAREAAIRAALGALDTSPVPLVHRERRARPTWLPALGAVAAAALLIVGVGALLATLDSDGGDDQGAESAATLQATDEELDTSAGAGGAARTEAGADAPVADAGSTSAALPELGDVADADALGEAIQEHAALRGPETAAAEASSATPCADRFTGSLVPVATARLDGRPVVVGVAEPPEGPRTFEAFDVDTCERVAGGELP